MSHPSRDAGDERPNFVGRSTRPLSARDESSRGEPWPSEPEHQPLSAFGAARPILPTRERSGSLRGDLPVPGRQGNFFPQLEDHPSTGTFQAQQLPPLGSTPYRGPMHPHPEYFVAPSTLASLPREGHSTRASGLPAPRTGPYLAAPTDPISRARSGSSVSSYNLSADSARSPQTPPAAGGGAGFGAGSSGVDRPRRRSRADLLPGPYSTTGSMSNRSRAATLSAASAHPYTFTEFPHQPGASASGQQEAGHEAAQPPQSSYPRAESSTAVATTPLEGISRVKAGLRYQLVVVQHPSRARMCGFGDKDRRPLSPTLIVKLVITEEATGEEVSPWKVNTSLFYLACDLCHPELLMASPRNVLVHHHSTTVPVPSPGLGNPSEYGAFPGPSSRPSSADYPSIRPPTPTTPGAGSLSSLAALHLGSRSRSSSDARGPYDTAMGSGVEISSSGSGMPPSILPAGLQTLTTESYTRNLVGASVASANVLKDERDHTCIFFVLQDLSVRTEGSYRLKLLFADLSRDGQSNEGVSTALAEVYTDPFTVYSPRRFPGMHDPTELSKKLAAQGVKIATRSDRKKRRRSGGQGAGASGAAGEEVGEEEDDE